MATELPPEQDEKRLFEDIDAYPWDSDTEFQVSNLTIYAWIIAEGYVRVVWPPFLAPKPPPPHPLRLRS
jgi:hypothetical protein